MASIKNYTIYPLGDSALLLTFGNTIDRDLNRHVAAVLHGFKERPFTGLIDMVPAYGSVTFCYDPFLIHSSIHYQTTVYDWVQQQVVNQMANLKLLENAKSQTVEIPVCYDVALNNHLSDVANQTGIPMAEIIQRHTEQTYFVYMIGFLPGFAYMGEVEKQLELARKPKPQKVKAGSVAIAGKQTGIYPSDSFGGWHVLGHTPVQLFDRTMEPVPGESYDPCFLKAGQEVRFYPVNLQEYQKLSENPNA